MTDIIASVQKTGRLAVIEDTVCAGSIGEKISSELLLAVVPVKNTMLRNLGSSFVTHGSVEALKKHLRLDKDSIAEDIAETMFGGNK
jgi:1-deoxy-D-xylulose-5-phosphate synthase